MDDASLAARQAGSQRGFFRALAGGSDGACLIELEGVQATAVPVRPWFGIFSSSFYDDLSALEGALRPLARAYADAGVRAWSVWVPPEDEVAAGLLEEHGFTSEASPLRMAAPLTEIDLDARRELDLVASPSWQAVARCNDRAWGVLDEWSMVPVFEDMDDPPSHLYAARWQGEVASALVAREQDGDCYLWFVSTVPEAQRQGLAAELIRHALREAAKRGCETTSLESTHAGERMYADLGYRPLGRYRRYEHRDP